MGNSFCDALRRIFCCCCKSGSAFSSEEEDETKEDAFVEVNLLRTDLNRTRKFHSNTIRTAKYTWYTALPLSLFFQFHKVSNVYFLFVMTISLIPGASPINPMSSVVPFSLVLGAGIIKDVWVDVRRQRADRAANESPVTILRDGRLVEIPSYQVYPGDVMVYHVGDEIKADCVVLNTSLPEGLLYIDTANLDGETNAKTRRAHAMTVDRLATIEDIDELAFDCDSLPMKKALRSSRQASALRAQREQRAMAQAKQSPLPLQPALPNMTAMPNSTSPLLSIGESTAAPFSSATCRTNTPPDIDCQPQDGMQGGHADKNQADGDDGAGFSTDLNTIGGIAIMGSAPNADLSSWVGKLRFPSGEVIPLGIEQFLPRGCVLRNTEWILATVMYAGKDTKILLNYNVRKEKYSIITKQLNYLNTFLFILNQVMMLTLCGVSVWFRKHHLAVHAKKTAHSMWYVQYQLAQYRDIVLFWWRYLTNFVLLSYLIPLSLYVTLEVNKAMQLLMMGADLRMAVRDEFSGEARLAKPKTAELNAQLAHVRYIFTDKTGTLTENLMTYVGGFVAGYPHDEVSNPGGIGEDLRQELVTRKSVARKMGIPEYVVNPTGGSMEFVTPLKSKDAVIGFQRGIYSREEEEVFRRTSRSMRMGGGGSSPFRKSIIAEVREEELEDNPRFRYLRALSLCHSVLCFNVKDVEGDSTAAEGQKKEKKEDCCCCCCCCCCDSSDGDNNAEGGNGEVEKTSGNLENLPEAVPVYQQSTDRLFTEVSCQPSAQGSFHFMDPSLGELRSRRSSLRSHDGITVDNPSLVINTRNLTPQGSRRGINRQVLSPQDGSRLKHFNCPPTRPVVGSPSSRGANEPDSKLADGVISPLSQDPPTVHFSNVPVDSRPSHRMYNDDMSPHRLSFAEGPNGNSRMTLTGFHSHHRMSASMGSHGGTIASGYHAARVSFHKVHGRSSSASWYYHQLSSSMAQNRLEASMMSGFIAPLQQCINRSKFYEGQSLDEVALVNAARENGFSLLDRSTRRMHVKMLDTVRCYTIIAENEFTPQRKLMSILLRRDPEQDNLDLEAEGAAARSYRRHKTPGALTAAEQNHGFRSPLAHTGASLRQPFQLTSHSPFQSWNDTDLGCGSGGLGGQDGIERSVSPLCLQQTGPSYSEEADAALPLAERVVPAPPSAAETQHTNSPKFREKTEFYSREAEEIGEKVQEDRRLDEDNDDNDDDNETRRPASDHPYLLLVKGADSSMLDIINRSNPENEKLLGPLMHNLEESAKLGLRTLVLGQRCVAPEEVESWLPALQNAMCSMSDRSGKLHEAYALIERDIDIIGSTSVEDKLQEGVPETLQFFLNASIVVWMLTGDKRETAVTIALTSGLATFENLECMVHLNAHEDLIMNPAGGAEDECHPNCADKHNAAKNIYQSAPPPMTPCSNAPISPLERVATQLLLAERVIAEKSLIFQGPSVVLVVDGRTLDTIFSDDELSHKFFLISNQCRSAVCCRMTPLQKAQIVRMFKKHTKMVTLAIGDGANDVSMIQESHIGIGIMGLEGSQAELSSDYAIPKFRFLKRLLMVHGRFSLYRDAHCVLYSIYKNAFLTVGMICYTCFSGFSGQTFIDSWYLAMFSVFFCSLQPLLVGIIDKDMDDELAESVPQLYAAISRENMYFSVPYIFKWIFDGVVEGIFSFFVLVFMLGRPDNLFRGHSGSLFDYGFIFFTALVLVSNLRVMLHLVYQNLMVTGLMVFLIFFSVVVEFVFSSFKSFGGSDWMVYVANEVYRTSMFYMYLIAAVGVCLLYTMASGMYIQVFAPWRNAPFAVLASRESPYNIEFEDNRKRLEVEYEQRVAYQIECDRIARFMAENDEEGMKME